MTTLLTVCVVVFFLTVWQRRTVMQIFAALGAQFSKLGRFIWGLDPIANYQAEVDRSAEEIKEASVGLESYQAMVTGLERKKTTCETQVANLTARIKNSLSSGDVAGEARASEYAVQLQKVQKELEEVKQHLQEYGVGYENNLKKVKYARQRIQVAKEKAHKLAADLNLSKVEAETAKLADNFNVRFDNLDGLGKIEEEVQHKIDSNRAKARVALDLSSDGLAEIEENERQQKAEAAEVLNKIRQEMKV